VLELWAPLPPNRVHKREHEYNNAEPEPGRPRAFYSVECEEASPQHKRNCGQEMLPLTQLSLSLSSFL